MILPRDVWFEIFSKGSSTSAVYSLRLVNRELRDAVDAFFTTTTIGRKSIRDDVDAIFFWHAGPLIHRLESICNGATEVANVLYRMFRGTCPTYTCRYSTLLRPVQQYKRLRRSSGRSRRCMHTNWWVDDVFNRVWEQTYRRRKAGGFDPTPTFPLVDLVILHHTAITVDAPGLANACQIAIREFS